MMINIKEDENLKVLKDRDMLMRNVKPHQKRKLLRQRSRIASVPTISTTLPPDEVDHEIDFDKLTNYVIAPRKCQSFDMKYQRLMSLPGLYQPRTPGPRTPVTPNFLQLPRIDRHLERLSIASPTCEFHDKDYDTDLDDDSNSKDNAPNEPRCIGVYETACRNLGVVVSRKALRNLGSDELDLRYQGLDDKDFHALSHALVVDYHTTKLILSDNNFTHDTIRHLGAVFVNNYFINYLDLSRNDLGPRAAESLFNTLGTCDRLDTLKLSRVGFDSRSAFYLVHIIKQCRLRQLDLSHNRFDYRLGLLLGPIVAENDLLEELNLGWNQLGDLGAKEMLKGLSENVTIKSFDISWNALTLKCGKILATCLADNRTVLDMDLSHNRLGEKIVRHISKGLKSNETLQYLKLKGNSLGAETCNKLVEDLVKIHRHTALKSLDISDVNIYHETEEFILRNAHNLPQILYARPLMLKKKKRSKTDVPDDPMTALLFYMTGRKWRPIELFNQLDRDKSGKVSREELAELIARQGINLRPSQIDKLLSKLDLDDDGMVDYTELLKIQDADDTK